MARAKEKPSPRKLKKNANKNKKRVASNNEILKKYKA